MLYVRSGSSSPAMAEINITPLIDVLLTVMIIFMITAPMVTKKIDFPLGTGTIEKNTFEPLVLTLSIHDSGDLILNGQSTNRFALGQSLRDAVVAGTPLQLDIRPEAHSSYDNLAQVLTIAQNSEVANLRVIAPAEE
jgi:biopolymer transport protein ExbD